MFETSNTRPVETNPKNQAKKKKNVKGPSKWNFQMRGDYMIRELRELTKRVEMIENRCCEDQQEGKNNDDEFTAVKDSLVASIFSVKKKIEQRYQARQINGTATEVVRLGREIQALIDELDRDFVLLKEAYKRQLDLKKLFTQAEFETKFAEMQSLRRQIEDCKELMASNNLSQKQVADRCDFIKIMEQEDQVQPPKAMGAWKEPSPEELAVMQRWAKRDADQDEQIRDVGRLVDQLGAIASEMHEKAVEQQIKGSHLTNQAELAGENLTDLNRRVADIVESGSSGGFFVLKMILMLTFMIEVGWLISLCLDKSKQAKYIK